MKKITIFLLLMMFVFSCSLPGGESANIEDNTETSTKEQILADNPDLPEECAQAKAEYLDNIKTTAEISKSINDSVYSGIYGSWGGSGGYKSFTIAPTNGSKIHFMSIRHGKFIDAIEVWYKSPQGNIIYGGKAGENGGQVTNIPFGENEYIV